MINVGFVLVLCYTVANGLNCRNGRIFKSRLVATVNTWNQQECSSDKFSTCIRREKILNPPIASNPSDIASVVEGWCGNASTCDLPCEKVNIPGNDPSAASFYQDYGLRYCSLTCCNTDDCNNVTTLLAPNEVIAGTSDKRITCSSGGKQTSPPIERWMEVLCETDPSANVNPEFLGNQCLRQEFSLELDDGAIVNIVVGECAFNATCMMSCQDFTDRLVQRWISGQVNLGYDLTTTKKIGSCSKICCNTANCNRYATSQSTTTETTTEKNQSMKQTATSRLLICILALLAFFCRFQLLI